MRTIILKFTDFRQNLESGQQIINAIASRGINPTQYYYVILDLIPDIS